MPEPGNPQAHNRYAYVGNSPLRYVDPSGHDWGDVTDFIRKIPSYDTTLNNLNLALTIVQHPEATGGQKAMAAGYIALEGTAHAAVVVGGAILAWEGAAAAAGSSAVKAAGAKLTAWALIHWKEVVVARAVAEEAIEAVSTDTPFDPAMVVLDVAGAGVLDDQVPRRQYSVAFEMELDPADYGRSRSVHFNRANAALDAAIQSDPGFGADMGTLIPGVAQSVSSTGRRQTPAEWTWHHDPDRPGVMQLVPSYQHISGSAWWTIFHPGGLGGYSIWAIPNGAPPNN